MLSAGATALGIVVVLELAAQGSSVQTLKSTGGLPAHIAGRFEDIGACERSPSGDYFVFDRRNHMVSLVPGTLDAPPRELVGVGVEPGRVLNPSAFDLAADKTFAIADAPFGQPRVQFFFETGARLGGFALPQPASAAAKSSTVFFNLIASVKYTGKSLFISQPESGTLIARVRGRWAADSILRRIATDGIRIGSRAAPGAECRTHRDRPARRFLLRFFRRHTAVSQVTTAGETALRAIHPGNRAR